MKAIIASALVAVTALAAVPASAQQVASGPLGAIAHFNQDADGQDQRVAATDRSLEGVSVSTRGNSALAQVFAHFNQDADTQDGIRGQGGATVVSGAPAFGADIFARLKAESAEDE